MTARAVKVLVPDDLGVKVLGESANFEAVRYEPGEPWPVSDATVVVVGQELAAAIGPRFSELPGLRLVKTLKAGYGQWLAQQPRHDM